jgi:hypothetical protein
MKNVSAQTLSCGKQERNSRVIGCSNIVKQPVRECIRSTNIYLFEVRYKQKLQLSKNCPLGGVKQAERFRDKRADITKKNAQVR